MTENLTSYFHNIFIISITGIITETIFSASAKNAKTLESGLKLVFSLCLLLSVIIPAVNIFKNIDTSFAEYSGKSYSVSETELSIISMTKYQLEAEVSKKIHEEFGIKPDNVNIEFLTEENEDSLNITIKQIDVTIPEEYIMHKNSIDQYVYELLGIQQ